MVSRKGRPVFWVNRVPSSSDTPEKRTSVNSGVEVGVLHSKKGIGRKEGFLLVFLKDLKIIDNYNEQ